MISLLIMSLTIKCHICNLCCHQYHNQNSSSLWPNSNYQEQSHPITNLKFGWTNKKACDILHRAFCNQHANTMGKNQNTHSAKWHSSLCISQPTCRHDGKELKHTLSQSAILHCAFCNQHADTIAKNWNTHSAKWHSSSCILQPTCRHNGKELKHTLGQMAFFIVHFATNMQTRWQRIETRTLEIDP